MSAAKCIDVSHKNSTHGELWTFESTAAVHRICSKASHKKAQQQILREIAVKEQAATLPAWFSCALLLPLSQHRHHAFMITAYKIAWTYFLPWA